MLHRSRSSAFIYSIELRKKFHNYSISFNSKWGKRDVTTITPVLCVLVALSHTSCMIIVYIIVVNTFLVDRLNIHFSRVFQTIHIALFTQNIPDFLGFGFPLFLTLHNKISSVEKPAQKVVFGAYGNQNKWSYIITSPNQQIPALTTFWTTCFNCANCKRISFF